MCTKQSAQFFHHCDVTTLVKYLYQSDISGPRAQTVPPQPKSCPPAWK